jgi:hypothetical protein
VRKVVVLRPLATDLVRERCVASVSAGLRPLIVDLVRERWAASVSAGLRPSAERWAAVGVGGGCLTVLGGLDEDSNGWNLRRRTTGAGISLVAGSRRRRSRRRVRSGEMGRTRKAQVPCVPSLSSVFFFLRYEVCVIVDKE